MRTNAKRTRLSALLILSGVVLAPGTAGAIETVVVTAERRVEPLEKTAISANVLSGEDLKDKGVNTLDQLQFATPSLSVQNYGTGDFVNLRGIGQSLFSIQVSSGVAVYFDGVPIGISGFLTDEPYYDMGSVEVLRGPQGTFAGLNSTGGAIFENSVDPEIGSTSGYAEASYGNFDDARIRGAVNLPIGDDAALRIAVNDEHRNSFFSISGPRTGNPGRLGESNTRIGFHWEPASNLDVLLKVNYNYIDNGGYPSVLDTTPSGAFFHPSFDTHLMGIENWMRASAQVTYTVPDVVVLNFRSSYTIARNAFDLDIDGTANPANQFIFNDIAWGDVYSEEVTARSPDASTSPISWLVGAFYTKQIIAVPPAAPGQIGQPGNNGFDLTLLVFPGGSVDDYLVYKERKASYAYFGQASYKPVDSVELSAGVRFTKSFARLDDSYLFYDKIPLGPPPAGNLVIPTAITNTIAGEHQSDSKVTGKVNLNWNYDADNFLYALASTGYKVGGINVNAPIGAAPGAPAPKFLPESVTDYEVGWKGAIFDRSLRVQLDGFYSSYRRFQVTIFDPITDQGLVKNASGTTTSDGIELSAQGDIDDFLFDLSGAYNHTALGPFFGADSRTPAFTPVNGPCNSATGPATPAIPGFAACLNDTGKPLPYAPMWTFSAGLSRTFALDGASLTPRIVYGMTGSQWSTVDDLPGDRIDAHNLFNAELELDCDKWAATLYSTNLFDLHYVAAKGVFAANTLIPGPPRQVGIRILRSF